MNPSAEFFVYRVTYHLVGMERTDTARLSERLVLMDSCEAWVRVARGYPSASCGPEKDQEIVITPHDKAAPLAH